MKPTLLLPLALLLLTSGCPFVDPGPSVPEPDDCTSPRALGGIESIEVGRLGESGFSPWGDGQVVDLTIGPQGGTMLGVVLSVSGRDLPACMAHFMRLDTAEVEGLAVTNHLVNTYDGAGGTRVTRMIWLVFSGYPEPGPGESMDLTLEIGDLRLRRSLIVGSALH